jgi:hypothetical protein
MTVSELIAKLQLMPQDSEVGMYYESGLRGHIKYLWLSKKNKVIVSDVGETIYGSEDAWPKYHYKTNRGVMNVEDINTDKTLRKDTIQTRLKDL